jgi:hypothetical protein
MEVWVRWELPEVAVSLKSDDSFFSSVEYIFL